MIVLFPVLRLLHHRFFQNIDKVAERFFFSMIYGRFDVCECEQCFPHGIGQSRANLQDTDAILDQLAQLEFCLIICGVSFKNKVWILLDGRHQITGLAAVILGTSVILFLDTWLYNNTHNILPGFLKPFSRKGLFKGFDSSLEIFNTGNLHTGTLFLCTSWNRYLTSHDVYRTYGIWILLQQLLIGFLADACQMRTALCDNRVTQTNVWIIIRNLHACIYMNFCKSGSYIAAYQLFCLFHRFLFR